MKLRNKYFILRHGETIYQTKKKDFTYPPHSRERPVIKLTKKGEKQIRFIAKKLKKEKIYLIFASDVYRTRQTAKIVAKELGLKVNFDRKLRDVNLGIYRGRRKTELYQAFSDVKLRFDRRIPKGESWQGCQKRMLNFLKDIDKKFKRKTILIISHADPLWLLEGAVKDWSFKKLLKIKTSRVNFIKTGELRRF